MQTFQNKNIVVKILLGMPKNFQSIKLGIEVFLNQEVSPPKKKLKLFLPLVLDIHRTHFTQYLHTYTHSECKIYTHYKH